MIASYLLSTQRVASTSWLGRFQKVVLDWRAFILELCALRGPVVAYIAIGVVAINPVAIGELTTFMVYGLVRGRQFTSSGFLTQGPSFSAERPIRPLSYLRIDTFRGTLARRFLSIRAPAEIEKRPGDADIVLENKVFS
jgi:hypothetical protein